jgi:hypothetical protein
MTTVFANTSAHIAEMQDKRTHFFLRVSTIRSQMYLIRVSNKRASSAARWISMPADPQDRTQTNQSESIGAASQLTIRATQHHNSDLGSRWGAESTKRASANPLRAAIVDRLESCRMGRLPSAMDVAFGGEQREGALHQEPLQHSNTTNTKNKPDRSGTRGRDAASKQSNENTRSEQGTTKGLETRWYVQRSEHLLRARVHVVEEGLHLDRQRPGAAHVLAPDLASTKGSELPPPGLVQVRKDRAHRHGSDATRKNPSAQASRTKSRSRH